MSTEKERIKNEAYQGANILYEDDYLIFVKINSLAAAKYFLPNRISNAYNRHYYKGNLYSIYDKQYSGDVNQTPKIITLYKTGLSDNENYIDIYDETGEKLTMGDIIKEYPNLKEIIVEEIGLSNLYNVLNSILNGVEYTEHQLKQIDPLISKFKYNETTPSKSMVTVRFDRLDEFLRIFDKDENEINFIERLYSPYYDYHEFYPEDYANDDWREGYLIREFSPENLEKVKQILRFLSPAHSKLENDNDFKQASILLLTTHDRKIEYIIGDYLSEMEDCKRNTLIEEIESDLCDPFINYGIFSKGNCMKSYVTTVRVLVSLYKMFKTDYDSLIDIFTKLGKNVKTYNYEEDHYSTDCSKKNFDDETFQRRVSSNLDDILDTIEENNDYFEDIEGYKNIIDNVLSKYEIDKSYNTPADKGTFRIVDIDPKTNKIDVYYWPKNKSVGERRRYDFQGFNDFLHNQELFEQKIRKLNKY